MERSFSLCLFVMYFFCNSIFDKVRFKRSNNFVSYSVLNKIFWRYLKELFLFSNAIFFILYFSHPIEAVYLSGVLLIFCSFFIMLAVLVSLGTYFDFCVAKIILKDWKKNLLWYPRQKKMTSAWSAIKLFIKTTLKYTR